VLQRIAAIRDKEKREALIGAGIRVRLETLIVDGDAVDGEFTRMQTTNFPSEVHATGTRPLPVAGPLGHGVAFRYDEKKSVMAIQYDKRTLSPGRAFEYISAKWDGASFRLLPKLRDDMWERFQGGPTRKISLTIANPTHYQVVAGAGQAAGQAARALATAYEAPMVTLELSMGHRKGGLSETVKRMAESLIKLSANDDVDLRTLKAYTAQGEGQPNDEIDLIDELLSVRDELTLPDNNPNRNYQIRRAFLRTVMNKHV